MKKFMFVALLSMSLGISQAQIGVKGGMNISTWHGDDVDANTLKSAAGFYLGMFYNINATHHFGIEPQVVYSTTGVKAQDDPNDRDRFSYIDITALFKWMAKSGFFFGGGPELDFLLSAKHKLGDVDTDIKDGVKKTYFYLAVVTGWDFDCGFGVYTRFNFGLTKLFEDDQDFDAKQNVLQF
ncbi:MAG TPA: porin family protein, partial [Chitinophagaceae bacterium]|nr:porin family protein [Chitinophagaceae bacterium]